MATACGRKGPDAPPTPNSMPDVFNFTEQANVTPNTVVTSNSITVSGINTAAQISVMNGEYSIDGGAYTSAVGKVSNGQNVTLQAALAKIPDDALAATIERHKKEEHQVAQK